jgi:hypothetical protein
MGLNVFKLFCEFLKKLKFREINRKNILGLFICVLG